ncbi:sensor histidine kinase [Paenibacillus psychroresistens]|uniref:Sensor histidine kinase n=1 Tax=Paenibacillus psychroresistens TaxID=1778678 RepID=A0A6B8RQL5_9BACL|nr:sensor histidine kinase [Paenibacillus psychroresistens]QGQ98681.1 sensor histidine kinase [Paenibacillus psychroresistens]
MLKLRTGLFGKLSLSQKLFLYLFLLIIVPLVSAAIIINSKASTVITNKTYENVFQTLKQTRFNLENILKEVNYLSVSIFSDDNVQELIKFHSEKSYLDMDRTKVKLQKAWGGTSFNSILGSKPYINSISISQDNEIIYQIGDLVQEDERQYTPIVTELKGKVFWTSLHQLDYLLPNSKNVVSLLRAVNNLDTTKQIAIERISLDEAVLSSFYAGINSWLKGEIYIIDAQGRVVSSQDKALLGKELGSESYIQKVLADEQEGSFSTRIDEASYSIFYCNLMEPGWRLVQIVPEGELNKQLKVINEFIIICIAICLLFGIYFSYAQNKSIVKPLKLLAKEMGKVKNGVFDVHLKVHSQDEIGRVSLIFINMIRQTKELIDKVYKSQLKEKEAELKALQAQINPHFLYNTLDSIRWLAVKNKDFAVSEQLEVLSDLFRHVLNNGEEVTTIGEEIEHLRNYMFIQNNRFGDKISFVQQIDPQLFTQKTIKLILQPLIENAIFHGLEPKIGKGTITLTIERKENKLIYVIADDGVGMDASQMTRILSHQMEQEHAFALKNIHDRIQLRFGGDYGLTIESEFNIGTAVHIIMPIMSDEGE